MKNKMLVTTAVLGLAASSARANPDPDAPTDIAGSDTMFEITTALIDGNASKGIAPTPGLTGVLKYIGTGSSAGGLAMNPANGTTDLDGSTAANQQVAPQSRFLNSTECTMAAFGTNAGSGYQIGLDAIAIFKDKTEDEADAVPEANACSVVRYAGCMEVLDLNDKAVLGFGNGAAGIDDGTGAGAITNLFLSDGPDADGVLDHYCFTHWADALRIIYTGQHAHVSDSAAAAACGANAPSASPFANRRCNSDVRRTLVENWANIFDRGADDGAGGCTDARCTSLKHAFRRDDLSGTTDTFLSLISAPGVTATPTQLGGQRAFCSGLENEDLDPIRRPCNLVANANNDPDAVCAPSRFRDRNIPFGADGSPSGAAGSTAAVNPPTVVVTDPNTWADLGLVLPVSLPTKQDITVNVGGNNIVVDTQYDEVFCSNAPAGGAFKFAQMPNALALNAQRCPNGNARLGGQCQAPIGATGTAHVGLFNCKAKRTTRPGGSAWSQFDARAYNLTPRHPVTGVILQPNHALINDPRWAGGGAYRLHQTLAKPTTPALAGTHPFCRQPDATEQIGCLVQAEHCSIGFAGLGATDDGTAQGSALLAALPGHNRKLKLRAQLDANTTETAAGDDTEVDSTDAEVQRLVDVSGATCVSGTGDFDIRYPLARILWLNAARGLGAGFSNISNTVDSTDNNNDNDLTTNELLFVQKYTDRSVMDPILDAFGFVRLPAAYPEASRFKQCP